MKFILTFIILLTAVCPLFAEDDSKKIAKPDDSKKAAAPSAAELFPPPLVFLAQNRLGLTPAQLEALSARVEKTQQSSDGAPVAVADLLTPEQLAKLREIAKDGGAQLAAETTKRLTEKMERVKEGARKMAEGGSDPSDVLSTMQQAFNPLMEAGKAIEAEAVLDRALKQLGVDEKSPETPSASPEAVQQRVAAKVQRVMQGAKEWAESGRDPSPIGKLMEEKVKPLLDTGMFAEAEPEVDRVLKFLGQDASPTPDMPEEPAPEAATFLKQVATGFRLAEGPVWDGENLIFSDVFPSKIHKLGAGGAVSTMRADTRKGAGLAFDSKGRLLICEVDGFRVTRIEKDGTETTLADSYAGKKLNGPNDLAVDGSDGIYFTDPLFLNQDKREQDKEAVYYISPEGKVLRVADDIEKPNGIALAGDGKTLFLADTAKSKLRAYPVKEDATLGEGRDFGTVSEPDGVRVDLDGKVYAAGKTGIAVWDATGKSLGTLNTPTRPNSLTFGGADRRTVFITTNSTVFTIRLDEVLKTPPAKEPSVATVSSPPVAPAQAMQQRVMAKIERIKEGVQDLAASGRDPSAILATMQEKVGPLLDAGKVAEAEPELDRVLELLKQDAK